LTKIGILNRIIDRGNSLAGMIILLKNQLSRNYSIQLENSKYIHEKNELYDNIRIFFQ